MLLDVLKDISINITEDQVLERLLDRYRWPYEYPWGQPSVEVITEDGNKHQEIFLEDKYLDSKKCINYYQQGYTLILSNIGSFNKETLLVANILEMIFKKPINCNFYFGKGTKSISFPSHNHNYAVIVKNIYGKSKWIIDGKEGIVQDQDVIWFDKHVNHEVVEINNAKLSMTCNIT